MSRLNLLLALALILSSLLLVKVSHDSRRLFVALEGAQSAARALEVDYKRLDAERQAQGTTQRVERLARDRLDMRAATPTVTHRVVDSAAPPTAAAGVTTAVSAARPEPGTEAVR